MNKTNYHNCTCKSVYYILLHLQSSNINFFEGLKGGENEMAIVEKRSGLSSSFLKGGGKTSLILNLEVSFLVVIKERRNFYIAFLLWTYL